MGAQATVMGGGHGTCHEWKAKLKPEYKHSITLLFIL